LYAIIRSVTPRRRAALARFPRVDFKVSWTVAHVELALSSDYE
jgi:hypothetical protein